MDPGSSAKGRFKAPPVTRGSSAAPPLPPPPKGAGHGSNDPMAPSSGYRAAAGASNAALHASQMGRGEVPT
eukprot:9927877-Prorocentrum_lima.AAC.1